MGNLKDQTRNLSRVHSFYQVEENKKYLSEYDQSYMSNLYLSQQLDKYGNITVRTKNTRSHDQKWKVPWQPDSTSAPWLLGKPSRAPLK